MRRIAAVLAILMLTAVPLPSAAQDHAHSIALPEGLKWVEPATRPGARLAMVQGDPSKEGLFVYRLRMPANYRIPPHYHKASENVTVLAGLFVIGVGETVDTKSGQELPLGGFASIPPNHAHYAWAGGQETVVQVHGVGPTDLRFVNPADDPRATK